ERLDLRAVMVRRYEHLVAGLEPERAHALPETVPSPGEEMAAGIVERSGSVRGPRDPDGRRQRRERGDERRGSAILADRLREGRVTRHRGAHGRCIVLPTSVDNPVDGVSMPRRFGPV